MVDGQTKTDLRLKINRELGMRNERCLVSHRLRYRLELNAADTEDGNFRSV
jgi:hypothetical protein